MTYEHFSLRATNLKCFGDEPQGFDCIKPVNLIIGRNNAGKSALIELVRQATLPAVNAPEHDWHKRQQSKLFSETPITETDVRQVFHATNTGGPIPGSHRVFGEQLIGASITVQLIGNKTAVFEDIRYGDDHIGPTPDLKNCISHATEMSNLPCRNPLYGKEFRRLAAERDIQPEPSGGSLQIAANGSGATNMIQRIINQISQRSDLVQVTLLEALNSVFHPDGSFTNIVCRQDGDANWEIFLDEAGKGRIALSQSGSGLKTIILALCFVHLLPVVLGKPLSDFVFAFEELENNLHPALQRRLLTYLADHASEHGAPIFLTTHSSVAIDLFSRRADAQILHVTHDGQQASCRAMVTYIDNHGILDDLDVRASDLLQSNGIIWVEGPSDRIYIARWISLFSDGELIEGQHFQCVFYGGRLLAHLTAGDSMDDAGVPILRVNRNAALVIDSDRRADDDPINATKNRLMSEINDVGGLSWITYGREIENYIPVGALKKWLGGDAEVTPQVDRYESFFDYLNRLAPGKGDKFRGKKPLLAEQIATHTTKDDLLVTPELATQLTDLCTRVRKWNSL